MSGGIRVIKVTPEMTPEQWQERERLYEKAKAARKEAVERHDRRQRQAHFDLQRSLDEIQAWYTDAVSRLVHPEEP